MRTCELAGFAARAEIDRDLLEWNSQTEGDPPECDIGFLDRDKIGEIPVYAR